MGNNRELKRINICGVEIDNYSMKETIEAIDSLIVKKESSFIVTPNVDHIVKLQANPEFRNIYKHAALSLADSAWVLLAGKFLKTPFKEKLSGSDIMPELCRYSAEKGHRLFFLGGKPGAAEKAKEVLEKKYSKIKIVGTYCPPFGFEKDEAENKKIVEMIKASAPDILFVGLGAPKQENWIYKYYQEINVPVSCGIGVTIEFMAGMVKRAPVWMQKMGLEWFWRLLMEPGKLWKRYLIEDLPFFWLVLKQKLGKTKN